MSNAPIDLPLIPEGGKPERLREVMRKDIEKWAKVINTALLQEK